MTSWLNKKVYDEEQLINAIAFILNKCKNCQLYHDDQCVINIIRSCIEIALLGDCPDNGSTFMYFADLNNKNKEEMGMYLAWLWQN